MVFKLENMFCERLTSFPPWKGESSHLIVPTIDSGLHMVGSRVDQRTASTWKGDFHAKL